MSVTYWLRLGRRTEGPFALDEVRRRAVRGRLTPAHSVSRDGTRWMAARGCREIFSEDGNPIPPDAGSPIGLEPGVPDEAGDWDAASFVEPTAAGEPSVRTSASAAHVATWPAHLSCALTLLMACALPMARDAEGPLWWWHIVRLWDLGGAGVVTAAIAWALVSVAAAATSVAIWLGAQPGRLVVLMASAIGSMALAAMAWGTGMAGGSWTLVQCAMVPVAAWAFVRSVERPAAIVRLAHGARHAIGHCGMAMAALGSVSIVMAAISFFARSGGASMACALLMLVAGAGAVASTVRWRMSGPDEWTSMIPCGVIVMACAAVLCDALAALAATPVPPVEGTRFAVLDAVRVIAVLLCQCALAYLAQRDNAAAPFAPSALAPTPGMMHT